MNRKQAAALLTAAMVIMTGLSACGKKTASQTGENILPSSNGDSSVSVLLDERTEDTQYQYGEDDLSLVDTGSGKKITLGMTKAQIEEVCGEAVEADNQYTTYDGVVVRYDGDMAVSLIVNGKFKDGKEKRFYTTRGVCVGTSAEDFKKAYGDSYSEGEETTEKDGTVSKSASRAVRYFEKDGNSINFLGTKLSSEQKSGDTSGYYIQDFMFSNQTGNIATIRVSLLSAARGGM